MLAAPLETVSDRGQADLLAALTAIDALLHRRIDVMSHTFSSCNWVYGCSSRLRPEPVTTIGFEKLNNPTLKARTYADFDVIP